MKWHPIETAPKDGTHIDLWANDRRLPDCWWGEDWWDEDERHWRQRYAEIASSFSISMRYPPSHWMALPGPPEPVEVGLVKASAEEERKQTAADRAFLDQYARGLKP